MPCPFPGMDPFIESQVWDDFHATIVPVFRAQLVPKLRPAYTCQVGKYVYLLSETNERERRVGPDVSVIEEPHPYDAKSPKTVATLEPQVMTLLTLPQIEQKFLQIRSHDDGEVVTVLELLSPTNKSLGHGHREYLQKRAEYARARVNIVEIDLLRGGQRLPFEESPPAGDFMVSVARAPDRPSAEVYAWSLRDALPTIPIPLKPGDRDVSLDLQAAFARVYDEAGYDFSIKYDREIEPPLSTADREWVRSVLNTRLGTPG